jgi:hypothetical protein
MTDLYTLVCKTAAKLQAEGKTPSLALVRAHAGKGLDAAALFSAYQQWRSQPPANTSLSNTGHETSADSSFTVAESPMPTEISTLRAEVATLHRKVDQLILLVEALSTSQGQPHGRR